MMSGTLPDRDHPSFFGVAPYQILNEKTEDRKKRASNKERCDEAFETFAGQRGRIIAETIALEAVLDKILASYYSPTISAGPKSGEASIELFGPRVHRSTEFYDLILCNIGFDRKIQILLKTLSVAGIVKPADLAKAFEDVKKKRNEFVHSLVGIDAETSDCLLWNSKKRTWEPVAPDVESVHHTECDKVMVGLSDVSDAIRQLLASGNQYPGMPI